MIAKVDYIVLQTVVIVVMGICKNGRHILVVPWFCAHFVLICIIKITLYAASVFIEMF